MTAGAVLPTDPGAIGLPAPAKPNIVLILTDDLSMNLLPYLPQVQDMQQHGTTFSNYFVTDSLCCPSRASLLTGKYPHNTKVYKNHPPDGGYAVFHRRNEEADTFATDLTAAGYRTALMGKYLNGYQPGTVADPGPVPPGWSEWAVGGNAYSEYNYRLNENGKVRRYGASARDYLTDVLARRGAAFIDHSVALKRPFLLELAAFAPHAPFTPAPRDSRKFPGLKAPRSAAFNVVTTNAPAWLSGRKPLTSKSIATMDAAFRERAQAVQAIGSMITRIQAELVAQGVADDTYLVFTSDNGLHQGEHRLETGKMTAFDTDIHVPLVVTGPGVLSGRTVTELAENIDLRPTFAVLAGATISPAIDGRDLSGLLRGTAQPDGRDAVLIEHHGPVTDPGDPDRQPSRSGNPPTYAALRGPDWLYVEYSTGEREYYDLATDPDELTNAVAALSPSRLEQLHAQTVRQQGCAGIVACR